MTFLAKSCVLFLAFSSPFATAEDAQEDYSGLHNREILLNLFQATGGFEWKNSTNWFQQRTDICDWKGVICYSDNESDGRRNGEVREIDLSSNNLAGTVPAVVFEIPFLETLNIENNPNLDVDFSGLAKAQYLLSLLISKTDVQDISKIGAASNLEKLHMSNLGLRGSIPDSIFDLTKLVGLYANYNSFSGTIPIRIGEFRDLDELYLFDNELTGQIPTQIGSLTGLEILNLGQNAFSGSLPMELNSLTNLQLLSIHREKDKEKGDGISGRVPPLYNHRKLTNVYLQNQNLTDELHPDFLLDCPVSEEVEVDLSNNKVEGQVSSSLKDKEFLSLFLANNLIETVSGELFNVTTNSCPDIGNWMDGTVRELGCDAFLCPPGTWAPEGRSTTDFKCEACSGLPRDGFWGTTECNGLTTPNNANGLRLLLEELYKELGGENWRRDEGWLQEDSTVCDWYGISCNKNGNVDSINLENNGLHGRFTTSDIFSIPELKILNLSQNSIEFDLAGIGNANKLEVLDLSSTNLQLSSLDALVELSSVPLTSLSLNSNNLAGAVPSALFSLTSLEELHISHCGFTGDLASEIGQLTNLKQLDCSGNSLSGQIPTEVGNLRRLQELLAGENVFGGSLPAQLNYLSGLTTLELQQVTETGGIDGPLLSFRDMGQLTSLMLDSNQLTGSLPLDFLANSVVLDSRIEVGLSFNQLEGMIPTSWSRFNQLFLNLAGNKITEIPNEICDLNNWMDGDVGNYQCDAILCPKGKYNVIGRRSDEESICSDCGREGSYFGATSCGEDFGSEGFGSGNFGAANADDVTILSELYVSTSGVSWSNRDGWGDTADFCEWYGIKCDAGKRVVSIDLSDNNLIGTVPSSVFELDNIRELSFAKNDVGFSFDGIEKAENLDTLDLGETNVKSIDGIGSATNLITLRLNGNDIGGPFPVGIYQLSGLQELNLGYNQLSGKLPNAIASLSSLTTLRLYHNQFTGRIPVALGDLTRLVELNMAENNFEGTIPLALNDLTDLKFLSLQREGGITGLLDVGVAQGVSSASGPGLTGPLPALEGLKSISELYLGVNSLTGSVPYNFLDGVVSKSALLKVDLTSNRITGTLPGSLSQFDKLDLYVADNRVTGIANALCKKSDWLSGDVKSFDCEGILCPANKYNPKFGRKRDTSNPCQDCSTGTDGILGGVECLTDQQQKEGGERRILEQLYRAASGDFWLSNEGWMDDDVSICDWYGVECESDENPSVVSIDLESNNLRGSVPTEVYQLSNLQTMSLQGNLVDLKFDGIGSATALESLDLEEMGLESLSGIKEASSLISLRIARNSLSTVPIQVFELTNLQVLDMSDNPFPDQPMPKVFENLQNLIYLGCSACSFIGTVPKHLGSMTNLQHIGLGQNGFSGGIPDFSQFVALYHLDLSGQKAEGFGLNGTLPDFSQQSELKELFLQNNALTGTMPSTLLQGLSSYERELVTIDLRFNALTGAVPTKLGRFPQLNLYLAGNKFDELSPLLCSMSYWNDREVGTNQCDAIMCPIGMFNSYGRAIGDLTCSDCDTAAYLGETSCGSSVEKPILIEFYRNTEGTSWTVDDNWLRNDDYCTWAGISCHKEGEFEGLVKEINLPNNNIIGTLPAAIWTTLEGLEVLNIPKNDIEVTFEFLSSAQNIQTIAISETNTKTLLGIGGAAASLKNLHVTDANLVGTIPDELFQLTLLENLYLSHNGLSGTLSTNFGNLKMLQHLYMFGNKLTGLLPTELGQIAKLKSLSLGENEFVGKVPRQIMGLPLLEILSLQKEQDEKCEDSFCSPTGSGLSGTVPSLDGLPRIKEVYLGHNKFAGTLPTQFLQGVSDKSKQILVDLSYNNINGTIPKELGEFSDLQLLLAGNSIDGIPDEICNKRAWFNGEVAAGCDAILCPKGTFNEFGRRTDSETPCHPCTYPGSSLFFGSTECGPVLVEEFTDRDMLKELYDAAGGSNWKNQNGWNRDDSNECDWFGITCEPNGQLGAMVVTEINLASNNLDGIIPSILYHMEDLRKLDVRYNPVEMQFFAIFRSDTLEELLLDRSLVHGLDGIGNAKALKTLHLEGASLGWQPIPEELFGVRTLEDLDLSNAMIGGTLSGSIGNLTSLKHLSLEGNAMAGELPTEIGLLQSLEELELSGNNWVGKLPETFESLKALRALYLDNSSGGRVGLTGPLPSFSTMPQLTELHLLDNQFTGSIASTFLADTNPTFTINVHLEKNALVGTIPSSLSSLSKLNIYLADNLITGIGEGLCEMSGWLDGSVGTYRCNAILCPPGHFSSSGREESGSVSCLSCPGEENSKVYGSSFCLEAEKQHERDILQQLYVATGGPAWHNEDRWNDNGFDYCSWHGITCTSESLVESIILGSNHLVGTLPTEVYQLVKLKHLWVYSNVIDLSFQGIEHATDLESLILDSTRLSSLEGIGKAVSLKELDIRFNNLGGIIPSEVNRLTSLERFLCSDNDFSGPVPDLTALRNLKILQMGNNQMTGTVPSFSRHPVLESLELADNNLAGTIPTNILDGVDPSLGIFLDLSDNSLTGKIPVALSRFDDMVLLLRNNKISEISPKLCDMKNWNGGDVDSFGCDGILCPPGSVSPYGRASRKLDVECTTCRTSHFGQTACSAPASVFSTESLLLMTASALTLASLWM